MVSRNTGRWLAAGGILGGSALAATGSLTALVDPYALLRLLDVLDAFPF
jgi:hypothetical protein